MLSFNNFTAIFCNVSGIAWDFSEKKNFQENCAVFILTLNTSQFRKNIEYPKRDQLNHKMVRINLAVLPICFVD